MLFNRAQLCGMDQGVAVLFRKIRRYLDFQSDTFNHTCKWAAVNPFHDLHTLGGQVPLLAKTQDKNPSLNPSLNGCLHLGDHGVVLKYRGLLKTLKTLTFKRLKTNNLKYCLYHNSISIHIEVDIQKFLLNICNF